MILTPEEVRTLTNRQRPGWQARQLKYLGIPFKRRSDGTVLVLSADLGQGHSPQATQRREPQLRFS